MGFALRTPILDAVLLHSNYKICAKIVCWRVLVWWREATPLVSRQAHARVAKQKFNTILFNFCNINCKNFKIVLI